MISIPSWNLTPSMTFSNCFSLFNLRQVFEASIIILIHIQYGNRTHAEGFRIGRRDTKEFGRQQYLGNLR